MRGSYSARGLSSPLRDDDLVKPIGPPYFAGEHTAGEWHGLMEGALRSGRRAAEQTSAPSGKGEWRKIKCPRQGKRTEIEGP